MALGCVFLYFPPIISTEPQQIVHEVDVLLSALRGEEAPEFGEAYAAISGHICKQLKALLDDPIHGAAFKKYLERWTAEA